LFDEVEAYGVKQIPRGVLEVYMTGGPTELHIANPKKYTSLKFYTQKNTWHQNFQPKKIQEHGTHVAEKKFE